MVKVYDTLDLSIEHVAIMNHGNVLRVLCSLPYIYGCTAVFNPQLPLLVHSGSTMLEGVSKVCIRYPIGPSKFRNGAHCVMLRSPHLVKLCIYTLWNLPYMVGCKAPVCPSHFPHSENPRLLNAFPNWCNAVPRACLERTIYIAIFILLWCCTESILPSFSYSQRTTTKGVSGVCIRYLIPSKHVWHDTYAVKPHSSFFGEPMYVPSLTTTVYGMFPNSCVDEWCSSFEKQQVMKLRSQFMQWYAW